MTSDGERPPARRYVLATTYAALREAGDWRPIHGCPGRLVLAGSGDISPRDLVGDAVAVHVHRVPSARDPVHVAAFAGGGLISYERGPGYFVHTLNSPEGFARKLAQLGIDPASP